jgi:hypothetical protein
MPDVGHAEDGCTDPACASARQYVQAAVDLKQVEQGLVAVAQRLVDRGIGNRLATASPPRRHEKAHLPRHSAHPDGQTRTTSERDSESDF